MARRSVTIDMEIRNKQARASLEGIESGFTNLRQSIDDPMAVRFDVDRARTSLQGIESGVTSLRQSTQQASSIARQSTGAMASGFNRASQQVRGNIQPVQNLTRIIEDAPFGIRGVANNINPFIQSFQRMQAQAGSTGAAMSSLLTSAFTGPGALLTISALVTSAMTAIQMGLFSWGEEAESTEDQMETLMETMDEFIDEQREMGGENIFDPLGQASTQQRLDRVKELRDELQSLFDLRSQAEELRSQVQQTRVEFTRSGSIIERSLERNQEEHDQLVAINQQIDKQEELFQDLSDVQKQNILDKIDDIEATEALNNAFLRLNPALQRQLSLNQALRPVLRDVELGLSGAREELQQLISGWEQEAEQLRENIEAGEFHGEELEEKKNILQALMESIQQAEKAEEGLTDQQKSAAEAAKQLTRARRELADEMGVEDTPMGMAEIDTGLEEDIARDTRIGSIGDLQADLKELNSELENVRIGSDRFNELNAEIAEVEKQLQRATGAAQEVGDTGRQALISTATAADMLGNALMQAIIRGEELEGVLKGLAAQLASTALIRGLTMLLSGGGLGFLDNVSSFGSGIFDTSTEGTISFGQDLLGFATGTDMGFPGVGRVGERGEELLVAPPMSSVITNENVERMDQWRSEAKQGAQNLSHFKTGQIQNEMMNALASVDWDNDVRLEGRDLVISIRKELKQQGGKGGNGSLQA